MENGLVLRLSSAEKLALGVAAFVAIAAPLVFAVVASALAQTSQPVVQSPDVTTEMRAEQALPRKVVPFDPTHFDRYVGYYQLDQPAFLR